MSSLSRTALVLVLAVTGCAATPPAVYELAEKTSANGGLFQYHLAEMAAQSKAQAAARAAHIAEMQAFNVELDTFLKREAYMREKAQGPSDWAKAEALMKDLAKLRDELIAIEAKAQFDAEEQRKVIVAGQKALDTYPSAMRDAANALNALARREDGRERARFFGRYAAEVSKEVRKSLNENDKTSQAAKALVDKVKTELRPARSASNDPVP